MITGIYHIYPNVLRHILATALTAEQGQAVNADEIEFHTSTTEPAAGCNQVEARYPALMSDGMGNATANEEYMKRLIRTTFEKKGYTVPADGIELQFVCRHFSPDRPDSERCTAVVTTQLDLPRY